MDFTGRALIPAPPQTVWDALNDPALLRRCIPGCETLEKTGPADFRAAVTVKIGPMKATFRGTVALTEQIPPQRCRLAGEGQGGAAGFAKGEADVTLTPAEDGTELSYTARATVGGKLAQVGQRLIDAAARQIADEFFSRFAAALSPAEAAPPAKPAAARGEGGTIWIVGLAAVVLILLVLFTVVW